MNLIVGNGINLAFDCWLKDTTTASNFSYDALMEGMQPVQGSDEKKILDEYTKSCKEKGEKLDVEFLLESIEEKGIENNIKKLFIKSLDTKHKQLSYKLATLDLGVFRDNLINVTNGLLFILNFDLKLYYIMKNQNLFGTKKNQYKNSFNDLFYDKYNITNFSFFQFCTNKQIPKNYIYLHGAVHLFSNKGQTYKLGNIQNGLNLPEKRQEIEAANTFDNVIVLEGNSGNKKNYIDNNSYLKSAYQNLSSLDGELIIYGCSMGQNDQHIWDKLNSNNKISTVYIGVDDQNDSARKAAIKQQMPQRTIQFFNHQDKNIWSTENWINQVIESSVV